MTIFVLLSTKYLIKEGSARQNRNETKYMNTERKYPSCGSTNLEPGKVQSTGRVYFRPENTKFLSLGTSDVELSANMCMDCGHVMLAGDLRKAAKLLDKAKAH